jgi:hypothetical protein
MFVFGIILQCDEDYDISLLLKKRGQKEAQLEFLSCRRIDSGKGIQFAHLTLQINLLSFNRIWSFGTF